MKKKSVLMPLIITVLALIIGIGRQDEYPDMARDFDVPPLIMKAYASEETEGTIPSQAPESGVYDPSSYLGEEIEERVGRINKEFARIVVQKPQIAILMLPRIPDGQTIESLANQVATDWKVGFSPSNCGLLVVVDVEGRQIRSEVSQAMGSLIDEESQKTLHESVTTDFQNGDYAKGITAYLDNYERIVYRKGLITPSKSSHSSVESNTYSLNDMSSGHQYDSDAATGALVPFGIIAGFFIMVVGIIKNMGASSSSDTPSEVVSDVTTGVQHSDSVTDTVSQEGALMAASSALDVLSDDTDSSYDSDDSASSWDGGDFLGDGFTDDW